MPIIARRGLIAGIGAGAAALGLAAPRRARAEPKPLALKDVKKETDMAAVYHCDFGQSPRFGQMLTNINNHLSAYEFDPFKIKIVIVAHGAGVKFFLKSQAGTPWEKEAVDDDVAQRLEALAKYGVEAYLCEITFKRLRVDKARIREAAYVRMVPSGVAAVAELQSKGFGYLKVA
jgi:hypothetical protein